MFQQTLPHKLAGKTLSQERLHTFIQKNQESITSLCEDIHQNKIPALTITATQQDIPVLTQLVESWQKLYTHIVFIGVGGSSLGAQTLVDFMGKFQTGAPRILFIDNADASTITKLLTSLPFETTGVISISKSGSTLETLAQTAVFLEAFLQKNHQPKAHIMGITEEGENPLRNLLSLHDIPILNHPKDVGGRFTLFTLVSLLPALVAGTDVTALRTGAYAILKDFLEAPETHSATEGAALSLLAFEAGVKTQVMMPYSDRLATFSKWFVQLWAESLGKEGFGTTPIPALGSTDQHSFLQLMMAGPNQHLITIITSEPEEGSLSVPARYAVSTGQKELENLAFDSLLYHQALGTAEALTVAERPVRLITLKHLSAYELGGLAMHFMLETLVAAKMWGINAFDQPGVEDGKKRTHAALLQTTQA